MIAAIIIGALFLAWRAGRAVKNTGRDLDQLDNWKVTTAHMDAWQQRENAAQCRRRFETPADRAFGPQP